MSSRESFSRTFLVPVVRSEHDGMLWGHLMECNCTSWGVDIPQLKERLTELVLDAHQTYVQHGCSFEATPTEEELLDGWEEIVCIEPLTVTFDG